jgi:hypothetical protein
MALSFRKDDKERKQKSLERAQKEAKMASESAKDARNRREAKIVANKLEAPVEQNEEKQVVENVLDETKDEIKVATRKDAKEELTAMQREQQQVVNKALDETKDEIKVATRKDAKEELTAMQREQQQVVNKALDETKDEIKVATREAAKEIPQYTQKLGDLQEQTIQTTREIADNYIESQKEIISIYQSVWTPFVENANSRFWNYWSVSPKGLAETYGTVVSSFADNVIAATRLTNNAISANMELFSTALQRTKDSSKEFSRLGVNAAKVFNEASNDFVTQVSLK